MGHERTRLVLTRSLVRVRRRLSACRPSTVDRTPAGSSGFNTGAALLRRCQAVHRRQSLVGTVADDVPWWIIVANPDLSLRTGGDCATDNACLAPDDLCVVAAESRAGIAANIVSARLLGPVADHLGW